MKLTRGWSLGRSWIHYDCVLVRERRLPCEDTDAEGRELCAGMSTTALLPRSRDSWSLQKLGETGGCPELSEGQGAAYPSMPGSKTAGESHPVCAA